MPPVKELRVVVNRYAALDGDGDPAGTVSNVHRRGGLVGAQREMRGGSVKIVYQDEPTALPNLPAYRAALRTGELLAADEPTARVAGRDFVPVAVALASAASAAAARHLAECGELPAWARPPASTPPSTPAP